MSVSASVAGSGEASAYEVGVAIMPLPDAYGAASEADENADSVPGYAETLGRFGGRTSRRPTVEKGEHALGAAIDAMAGHIGMIAERIGSAIAASGHFATELATPPPQSATAVPQSPEIGTPSRGAPALGIESVQVCFGVTLSAGLQTVFTAQAESSAQVTLTLSRRP